MQLMGIDIGGSGIKGALVDHVTGELVSERKRIPTPSGAMPEDVAETVHQLIEQFGYRGPIGVGFPAAILHGIVKTASNIDQSWIGTDIDRLLTEQTGQATFSLNDADSAGLAEMRYGAGKDYTRGVVIVLTLGTGIGSAIFTDGHLVPNTEFGHLLIREKPAEHRASDAARQRKDLSWTKYALRLEEYLREMEKLFWPDLFIIGGGLSKSSEKFFPLINIKTPMIPAQFLNQAGIIGAAIYAAEKGDLAASTAAAD